MLFGHAGITLLEEVCRSWFWGYMLHFTSIMFAPWVAPPLI